MNTVRLVRVLEEIAGLLGAELFAAGSPDFVGAIASLNRHLERGWQHDFWPEWTVVEKRAWRDDWAAGTTYAEAAVVYFTDDGKYYAANSSPNTPAAGESPATHPAKWTETTDFARYLAPEQAGKTAIGEVRRLCRYDPRLQPDRPGSVLFRPTHRGWMPEGRLGATFWAEFRLRVPVFSASLYAEATAYVVDDVIYDEASGDCWRALQATTGNPVSSSAHWARVEFPARLKAFVVQAVYADLLRADDQTGKAFAEDSKAVQYLYQAADAAFVGQEPE